MNATRSKLSVGLYLLVVFLSGTLVGAFAYRLYMVNTVASESRPRTAEEWRQQYQAEMRSRLHLSDEQFGQLQSLMDETRQRYRALREQGKPLVKAIDDDYTRQVRAMLNESQRAEYEKIRAERERRRQEKKPGAPPTG